ncbi:MAG: hypothetical protein ABIR06_06500 [Cyclobacteriaceae bacterium]
MKTYVLSITFSLLILYHSTAAIKNGYGIDIVGARESLRSLKLLLKDNVQLSVFQRISINTKINDLENFIIYFELTETLLEQFKMISPELYFEIDMIKDSSGTMLDVYVKFVPEKEMVAGVAGTTNLAQEEKDQNAYSSEYGVRTVSVKIAIVNNALSLLAHEFGHVKYQVPNLATYCKFHSKYYLENGYKGKSMGHNDNDPSGQHAREYGKRFREKSLAYQRQNKTKLNSNLVLLQVIKNKLN